MTVVTRFAPSPTGYLHIGGARTALFNWLYARHHGGVFRLRIEDTDRQRSTDAAVEAIIDGLGWLGLAWDEEIVFQFARAPRHAEVALAMLAEGRAYRCWATPEELEEMRARAKAEGRPIRYDGRWRDRDPAEAPPGIKPVIRLRAPQEGETVIHDLVQGEVRVANEQLDDMVLLRGDGTPTYMLSVVVDDHDMAVTHVIRGDDHLTNTFRQTQIYRAMGWDVPEFAHIPLIHGPDGAKLSKRHGALGVEAYRDMGYLPEALCNYLLRLGWGHGDEEIIPIEQAVAWFDLDAVGRSPSRLDFDKLDNLNGHYLRQADDQRLLQALLPFVADAAGGTPDAVGMERLARGMAGLKVRARTLKELAALAAFYVRRRPLAMDEKATRLLSADARALLGRLLPGLAAVDGWNAEAVESAVRAFAERAGAKLGNVAQPLRAALTGSSVSPGIFEVMEILGRTETLERIGDVAQAV
ncbi:glutamate--tRNA ligase [Stella sp.]|uniref:glutamate--tRNA ligase n=1 Tax=Stella sp. TaxID=2912054 RepID=UPI0035AF1EBD